MKKLIIILFILTICISTVVGQISVMTMTTTKAIGSTFTFFVQANNVNTPINVDFGDGTLVNFIVGTASTTITGLLVESPIVKIYGNGLIYLDCHSNQLTTLDVSQNIFLIGLFCSYNDLFTLDVTHNNALSALWCHNNKLNSLDLTNNLNTTLITLDCHGNPLTSLDVTRNITLSNLDCNFNQLTALDISKNTALTELSCYHNQLTNLDLTKNTKITKVQCHSNQLTSLDVGQNTALTGLYCSSNRLTALDVTKNSALTELDCDVNKLTNLDVTRNIVLTKLWCSNNQLTELESQSTVLTWLYCSENQLTTLNVTKNGALTGLNCLNNQLKTLDLTNNVALTFLACAGNKLTFSTLPLPFKFASGMYFYAGQKPVTIAKSLVTGAELDLSSQFMINGIRTSYTWKNQNGIALYQGIDFTFNNGKTVFLKAQSDSVFCEMTNTIFPDFTGSGVLKTTKTMITSITGIEEVAAPIFEIYAHDKSININLSYNAQLSIFDLSGRLIIFKPIYSGINSFQLSKTGVYIVKIINKQDAVFRKVLVE